jgi:hypothetical protein
VPIRGLLVPLDIEPPLEEADPALLPPELDPPRAVALPPVDEPLPVGRRLSCASAGAASASARSAVTEILVDACMAEPLEPLTEQLCCQRAPSKLRAFPQGFKAGGSERVLPR